MRTYGIIGFPLNHSFSQTYFTDKFEKEGDVDCTYKNFPIQSIQEIKVLLKNEPSLKGLNVTIPYKQLVLTYLDDIANIPPGLQACNCIKIEKDKLIGYNTDIIGFERSLFPLLEKHHTHALVLGNGGAAEAVRFVLDKLKIDCTTVSRKKHNRATFMYADLDRSVMEKYKLIINTTPLGTFPDVNDSPEIPYQYLSDRHLLYDLVYNPAKTLFLQKGQEQGAAIKNGYEMLLIQAEESWRIWNGV